MILSIRWPVISEARTGDRLMFALRRVMQILVVIIKRLVVIIDARQMRVGEDFTQQHRAIAHARLQFTVDFADPAALPFFLVFPVVRGNRRPAYFPRC